jgi:hypothetical protein
MVREKREREIQELWDTITGEGLEVTTIVGVQSS